MFLEWSAQIETGVEVSDKENMVTFEMDCPRHENSSR